MRTPRRTAALIEIATVTPFSNNVSILAYPKADDADLDTDAARNLDRLFAAAELRLGDGASERRVRIVRAD